MARTTVENIFAGCDLPTCAWRAQTVHVKPPPNAPSSSEATDVYIPGAETSVPSPGRAVGRGQKVSLRSVPDKTTPENSLTFSLKTTMKDC
ncbi:uncharacterized protein LOC144928074 isoform X3 [Branchiostoma floridae x Branchiostoma belcheri]